MNLGIKHTLGVANYMKENASSFGLDPEDMWVLGYLHDISNHMEASSKCDENSVILHKLGFRLAQYTSWCHESPIKYCKNFIVELPPTKLILLWKAMYSVNSEGEVVGYDELLKELKLKLGVLNVRYMVAAETVDWLKKYEETLNK